MKLIKNYTESNDVKEVQQWLKELGYYTGSVDGKFGSKSEKATIDFQKSVGLERDGIIGEKTMNALKNAINKKHQKEDQQKQENTQNSNLVELKRNIKVDFPLMRGDDVKSVQNMLASLKYPVGKIDGVYGIKTENAVKSFQQKYRLNIDGIVGQKTFKKLLEVIGGNVVTLPMPPVKPTKPIVEESEIDKKIKAFIDSVSKCVNGWYVFGAQGHKMTVDFVNRKAKKNPTYFTNGRKQAMLDAALMCEMSGVWSFPKDYSWDCSGLIWDTMSKLGYIKDKNGNVIKDSNAHYTYHSYCKPIKKSELKAGDFVFYKNSLGRITHVAVVGYDGVIYEAMSGYVGVVENANVDINSAKKRSVFGGGKYTRKAWNVFGRPVCFCE